jgi:hypothetical protein
LGFRFFSETPEDEHETNLLGSLHRLGRDNDTFSHLTGISPDQYKLGSHINMLENGFTPDGIGVA